ncbi:ABC transporter ATPase [Seminavis robusta]|uniref:ABC transporter ATPase n=1 Tax=Seminavis robusta TaxID=568900 RepID=A0A9N8HJL4_9STRA|nr:ABC transporter ATPase [Seminavis robusta]|eukprot:Sro869_g213510.1 ABC transporter ATPase (709) ;mRNA; f:32008-34412
MWTTVCLQDPALSHRAAHHSSYSPSAVNQHRNSVIVHSKASFAAILAASNSDTDVLTAFQEGLRPARVALADFCSRTVADFFRKNLLTTTTAGDNQLALEPLDYACTGGRRKKQATFTSGHTPYILERTDVWSTNEEVHVMLRARLTNNTTAAVNGKNMQDSNNTNGNGEVEQASSKLLNGCLGPQNASFVSQAMNHIACVVAQTRLRSRLEQLQAVAFIADGSILPRKSGANNAPMASPPAVPCQAPSDSKMKQTLQVDLGSLRRFLLTAPSVAQDASSTMFEITGMVVPKGITLVAGGGYHGKSTILRAIAAGVYDKVPGDGREFCVTVPETTSIRAEDGRYVQNCNISAFISNLPTPPGVKETVDTTHFSTNEASGSTSQAANVVEAIEMGAKVFLVDEDVSAANFMARDGRMRALVMDESITPLLYRVNGMYQSLGISCIVVVGGVGDWLDVPDQVILMNKYVASDATKKAASISYQFSHGHVQYAGKGLVHQLEWDRKGTPFARRPTDGFLKQFEPATSAISLLDGGHAISIHPVDTGDDDDATMTDVTVLDDDDDGYIDLSRSEQLMGKKPQLYACGQCVLWLIREAQAHPGVGMSELLSKLDATIDNKGMLEVFTANSPLDLTKSSHWVNLLAASGFAFRPRKYEIGQAFYRMRGIKLEHIPEEEDAEEERIRKEAERRKRELAELWAKRRPNSVNDPAEQ